MSSLEIINSNFNLVLNLQPGKVKSMVHADSQADVESFRQETVDREYEDDDAY